MLSVVNIFTSSFEQIRKNFAVMACFWIMFAAGNYIFFRLDTMFPPIMVAHLFAVYVFSYFFFRVYFNQKPIANFENFIICAAKMLVIFVLSFFAVMVLNIAFRMMYMFAKLLSVYPSVYDFLGGIYHYIKDFSYLPAAFFFVVLMFTFFIPSFAWLSILREKDGSILFNFLEMKGKYIRVFLCYLVIFGIIPMLINVVVYFLVLPLLSAMAVSSASYIFQLVAYAEMYKILFASSPFFK